MLNLRFIQENPELIIKKLEIRNFDASEIVKDIVGLYDRKRRVQGLADQAKAEMNHISKEIGVLMREGKEEEVVAARKKTLKLKEIIKKYDKEFAGIEEEVSELQVQLNKKHHESVA